MSNTSPGYSRMGIPSESRGYIQYLLDPSSDDKQSRFLLHYATRSQVGSLGEIFYNIRVNLDSFPTPIVTELRKHLPLIEKLGSKDISWKDRRDLVARKRRTVLRLLKLTAPLIHTVLH